MRYARIAHVTARAPPVCMRTHAPTCTTRNPTKGQLMPTGFFSAYGPDTSALTLPLWLDLASVIVGAISGVLVAQQKKLDLVGFMALAVMGGLGGGLIRDTIMQRGGVYALDSTFAIPSTVITALCAFMFPSALTRHPRCVEWVDIISIGLFAAAGTDKAMSFMLSPWACVLMGTLTAVGGGMIRDVCTHDTPRIFKSSNYYAICAIAGSVVSYVSVFVLYINRPIAATLCVVTVVILRRISLHFNLITPNNVDFTPRVRAGAQRVKNHLTRR